MTPEVIQTKLRHKHASLPWCVHVFDSVPSTNDYLLQLAAKNDVHAHICVAKHQTAGRGRLGRRWHDEQQNALMFSLGWSNSENLPLAVIAGYAVLQALHRLGVRDLALKWPNDVLLFEGKLAGILVETKASQSVVGIGVNMSGGADLAMLLGRKVSDLTDYDITMPDLLVEICAQFVSVSYQFTQLGAEKFAQAWNAWHYYHDQEVVVHGVKENQAAQQVRVVGLANDGRLRVYCKQEAKEILVNAGEFSLKA